MYNKERVSLDVMRVCKPKGIISCTFFKNLIFTARHLTKKLMYPDSRQIRIEASTALPVVMRNVLGE
jgi:hypothetical protein